MELPLRRICVWGAPHVVSLPTAGNERRPDWIAAGLVYG